MARTTEARWRALETAERLFRTQGYASTGLTQILEESGAPKGSFYFHFADGKEQLAKEVLEAYGKRVEFGIQALATRYEGDATAFVRALCRSMAKEMEASDWKLGCVAQNLANELAPDNAIIAHRLAVVIDSWIDVVARVFTTRDTAHATAKRRATSLVAALQGARTLARIKRSAQPFDAIAEQYQASVQGSGSDSCH
jgi:AcrR family transcriptional regulator